MLIHVSVNSFCFVYRDDLKQRELTNVLPELMLFLHESR